MKKVTALLLILLLMTAIFTACGESSQKEDNGKQGDDAPSAQNMGTEETTKPSEKPNFSDKNYNGQKFMILYPQWSLIDLYYFAEEANGDAMNDAAYERTQKINEELGIEIGWYKPGIITTVMPVLRSVVMSGSDEYDLLLTHCVQDINLNIASQLIMNWNNIPNIDMSKSYWNTSVSDNFEAYGMLGYAVNDLILPDVNSIFFNKQLQENLQIGNIYDIVDSGKWTWDKLTEFAKVGYADLNGDGVVDSDDQFGFVGEMGWQWGSIPSSAGLLFVGADSDGVPQVDVKTEKMFLLLEKVYNLLHTDRASYTWNYKIEYDPNVGGVPPIDFASGKSLFYYVPLSLASTFRSMDIDFGIIPIPKLDEKQETYTTLNWSGFIAVPMTAPDPDLTGKVVELCGYYNQQIVVPVFYDVLLGQKISRDNDSLKMLDIMFKNSVYDLGVALMMYTMPQTLLAGKGDNFASYIESNMNPWQKLLDDYLKACREYMEAQG
ncbi:MAG: hypothetical protein FWF15_09870 [Oscillospiraceae bacterium]|nr:hypothetical protein [Oscillospiraceae bacterium]